MCEFMGSYRLVYVDTDAGRIVVRTPQDRPLAVGTRLGLRLDPERCVLFAEEPL
jgi:ABC-type sugar transport system ATPase subunit